MNIQKTKKSINSIGKRTLNTKGLLKKLIRETIANGFSRTNEMFKVNYAVIVGWTLVLTSGVAFWFWIYSLVKVYWK